MFINVSLNFLNIILNMYLLKIVEIDGNIYSTFGKMVLNNYCYERLMSYHLLQVITFIKLIAIIQLNIMFILLCSYNINNCFVLSLFVS